MPSPDVSQSETAAKAVTTDRAPATARNIVLLWCLWLLGSWTVTMRIDAVVPATRLMMHACMIGLMIIWPAFRLGQDLPRRSAALIVLWDWLCLNLVFQAVIWPLQVSAGWHGWQAMWLDIAVAAWSGLTGMVLALGAGWQGGFRRALAMVLCMALLLGEPLVLAVLNRVLTDAAPITWTLRLSPVAVIRDLTAAEPIAPAASIISVAIAAGLGWIAVAVRRR